MSAHTPGPWAMNPIVATVDAMPSLVPVCQLLWPTDLRSEAETEANAKLIAAAPDLLSALINAEASLRELEYVVECERGDCRSYSEIEAAKDWSESVYIARAAIVKATGDAA